MSRLETWLEHRALAYIRDLPAAVPSRHKLDIRDTWNSMLKGGGGGEGKKSVLLFEVFENQELQPKGIIFPFLGSITSKIAQDDQMANGQRPESSLLVNYA